MLDFIEQTGLPVKFFTSWAFYFEGKRFFEGNRALFTNENIKKPVFNAFSMLEMLGRPRLPLVPGHDSQQARQDHAFAQVDGLASLHTDGTIRIIVWNFCEDYLDSGSDTCQVIVQDLQDLPVHGSALAVKRWQIDRNTSNSHTVWQRLGAPQDPTPAQIAEIKQGSHLEEANDDVNVQIKEAEREVVLEFGLPRPGVCLLKVNTKL
jgi:xylan 1,4-beta-xylosidase